MHAVRDHLGSFQFAPCCHPRLLGLDPHGPHDLRHTFATWLKDDGIPARVIDEPMGHAATRRSSWAAEGMSAMGGVYRHTTTEMETRILQALDRGLPRRSQSWKPRVDGTTDGTRAAAPLPDSAVIDRFPWSWLTRPPVIRGFALCLPLSVPLWRGGRADAKRR
jgi:hypothetical protein